MSTESHAAKIPLPETSTPLTPAAGTLSDPERWVELYGDYLFKYALMRLRDTAKAEDAVQETFLAALKGGKTFAGLSADFVRTAKKGAPGLNPFAGRFTISQSLKSPLPPSEIVPVPIPPIGSAIWLRCF